MPVNYVQLDLTNRFGNQLFNAICALANEQGKLAQLKADMDNMTDGITFATLESACGIPTGKGQTVYNLVAGTVADMAASTNLTNLLAWLAAFR